MIAFIIIMAISRILRFGLLPTHFYLARSLGAPLYRCIWEILSPTPPRPIDRTLQLRLLASFSIRTPQFPKLLSPPRIELYILLSLGRFILGYLIHFICGCLVSGPSQKCSLGPIQSAACLMIQMMMLKTKSNKLSLLA